MDVCVVKYAIFVLMTINTKKMSRENICKAASLMTLGVLSVAFMGCMGNGSRVEERDGGGGMATFVSAVPSEEVLLETYGAAEIGKGTHVYGWSFGIEDLSTELGNEWPKGWPEGWIDAEDDWRPEGIEHDPTPARRAMLPEARKDLHEQILLRKGYTVSYNWETREPNWVAWVLTASHAADVTYDRPTNRNAFHMDKEVREPRAMREDYTGSGYSRGHQCPAGDCRWDKDAMYETFLMTNMCPQTQYINGGVWNTIEMSCRQWAVTYGEIEIVCGPIFFKSGEVRTIGENKVRVPDAFFKVIACIRNGEPKGIGFVCRNMEKSDDPNAAMGSGRRKQQTYVHTIDEVERITGYNFFPLLDKETEAAVEGSCDYDDWRFPKNIKR